MTTGSRVPTEIAGPEDWLRRFASLPLIAQPGERWMYQYGSDVLGILVARISGRSLGSFMRERIFEPLGMRDTSFVLPADKVDRLPVFYRFDHDSGIFQFIDDPARGAWLGDGTLESGAAGLLSTADDWLAFSRMLLNKGRLGGERILSRAAVELMTTDQLTSEQREGAEVFFGDYRSRAMGMAVDTARRQVYTNPGRFGWDGGFGTTAWVDPAERLVGLVFLQRTADSPEPAGWYTDFWTQTSTRSRTSSGAGTGAVGGRI